MHCRWKYKGLGYAKVNQYRIRSLFERLIWHERTAVTFFILITDVFAVSVTVNFISSQTKFGLPFPQLALPAAGFQPGADRSTRRLRGTV